MNTAEQANNAAFQIGEASVSIEGAAPVVVESKKDNPPIDVLHALKDVRDMLAKGWSEEALKYIEDLLAFDPTLGQRMTPLGHVGAFESSFMTAARKHGVIAAFVVIERSMNLAQNKEKYKMHTGGHHIADAILSYHLQPLAKRLASSDSNDLNPEKSYLEIIEMRRRKPF